MSIGAIPSSVSEGDLVWLPEGSGPYPVVRVYDKVLLIRYEGSTQQYLRGIRMTEVVRIEKPQPQQH